MSVSSFAEDKPASTTGNFGGFLHVIDANFEPSREVPVTAPTAQSNPPRYPTHKPGYDGTFKILDQLVWPELYALNVQMGSVVRFEEMWVVSAQHPWAVYTGPTVAVTRRSWREMRGLGGHMIKLAKVESDKRRQGS